MLSSRDVCKKYDLSSVRVLFTGAAPLGKETVVELLKLYPNWHIVQGYGMCDHGFFPRLCGHINRELGMTETATVVCATSEDDIDTGTSGSLIPGTRAKVIDADGREITEYSKPGELLVQSPSVTIGYLNNEKATAEAFIWDEDGRWLRTGDEVIVTKSPKGNEHFTIVDRLKELIKVKVCFFPPINLVCHRIKTNLGRKGPPSCAGRAGSSPPHTPDC